MFRVLLLFPPSSIGKARMEPLPSVILVNHTKEHGDIKLAVSPDVVFTTAIRYGSNQPSESII
jgi:trehalose 6-phosphate synthase/phosphatase